MPNRYRLIPAWVNILGTSGDANEGDFATLSAAPAAKEPEPSK